jgi:hypothetical protein
LIAQAIFEHARDRYCLAGRTADEKRSVPADLRKEALKIGLADEQIALQDAVREQAATRNRTV